MKKKTEGTSFGTWGNLTQLKARVAAGKKNYSQRAKRMRNQGMTPLVENVHYRKQVYATGKFGDDWYCSDVINGQATVLYRTDPDISLDDLAREGDRQRRSRISLTKTERKR